MAADWLVRHATPRFLELVDRVDEAELLRYLDPIETSDLVGRAPRAGVIAGILQPLGGLLRLERMEVHNAHLAAGHLPTVLAYGADLRFRQEVMPGLSELGSWARWQFQRSRLGWHAYYVMCGAIAVTQLHWDVAHPDAGVPAPALVDGYLEVMDTVAGLVHMERLVASL